MSCREAVPPRHRGFAKSVATQRVYLRFRIRSVYGVGLAYRQGVECWIGVVQEADRRVVRLAGRLSVAQVPELLGACAGGAPLEIDLTELVSADVAGIEALQRLRGQGATLVGAPGYLQLKLDTPSGEPGIVSPTKDRPRRDR